MNKDFYGIVRAIKNDNSNISEKTKELFDIINEENSLNLEEMQDISYYLKDLPANSKTELIHLFSKNNLLNNDKFIFLRYLSENYDVEQQIKNVYQQKSDLTKSFKSPSDIFSKETKEKTIRFSNMLDGLKSLLKTDFEEWLVTKIEKQEKYKEYQIKKPADQREISKSFSEFQKIKSPRFGSPNSFVRKTSLWLAYSNGISHDRLKASTHTIKIGINDYGEVGISIDFLCNRMKLQGLHLVSFNNFNHNQIKDVLTGKYFLDHFYDYISEVMSSKKNLYKNHLKYDLYILKKDDSNEVGFIGGKNFSRIWLLRQDVDTGYFHLHEGKDKKLIVVSNDFYEILSYLVCSRF